MSRITLTFCWFRKHSLLFSSWQFCLNEAARWLAGSCTTRHIFADFSLAMFLFVLLMKEKREGARANEMGGDIEED